MSGQDLILQLGEKVRLLDAALGQLGKRGRERAEAERAYRVELSKTMLTERANGTPATILSDICRGKADIALLKVKRDIADAEYDAAKEACNIYKLQIRVLEEAIEREWRSQ